MVAILYFAMPEKILDCDADGGERDGTGNYETPGIPLRKKYLCREGERERDEEGRRITSGAAERGNANK